MNDHNEHGAHYHTPEIVKDHKLIVFIGASITVALLLVWVAMQLYASNGTAQLDLSRPGLSNVRNSTSSRSDDTYKGFPSNGTLDQAALTKFNQLYRDKLNEATSVDAFGNDVLSPAALQIDDKSAHNNPNFNQ